MKNKDLIIPKQKKGSQNDYSKTKNVANGFKVESFYNSSGKKLIDINNWHELCDAASAYFTLTDINGKEKSGDPEINDHIRIGIPGPGSIEGDSYDWVKIEAVKFSQFSGDYDASYLMMRPAENPFNKNGCTAHFLTSDSTNTLIVEHDKDSVTASHHGRNESANTGETDELLEKVRHLVVALGAKAGFSKVQWKILIDNIVEDKDETHNQ
ncbi:MAG: hypothetical protein ABIY50_08690 [Ignavibacteria bacterium]